MRQHINFTSVISLIALFAALGGGAYAASVKKNTVTSKSIKDGQVRSQDVADDGLTGTDIDESTLTLPPSGGGGGVADGAGTGPAGGDLAGSYPNPTIKNDAVNGAKVADDSLDAADIDESTLSAANADLLDGQNSTDFLGAGAKAADSELLDGISSNGFVQGDAKIVFGGTVQPGAGGSELSGSFIPGFGSVAVQCGTNGGGDPGVAKARYKNDMPGGSNPQRVLTVNETGADGGDAAIENDFVNPAGFTTQVKTSSAGDNVMHVEYWVIGPVPSDFARFEIVGVDAGAACLFTGQVTHSL